MTEGGDPAIAVATAEINFPARRRASVVFARRDAAPADVVRALDVPAPRGVLVLNGGTAGFSPEVEARLAPLLADGVEEVAGEHACGLLAQELPPARSRAPRCGRKTVGKQDAPDCARRHTQAELLKRLLCLSATRDPADLWPRRAATLEPIPVRPKGLAVRAPRLQLEHLALLHHHRTSSIDNEIEESEPQRARPDDHLSQREGVRRRSSARLAALEVLRA
jgi:hypothetical protein